MKKLFLILVILFISISAVSASQNATDEGNVTQDAVSLVSQDLIQDAQNDISSENNSGDGNESGGETNSTPNDYIVVKGSNLVAYYKSKPVYTFTVVNSTNSPVVGLKVNLIFNGKSYNRITDSMGRVSLNLPAKVGKYVIGLKYDNYTVKKSIVLFKSRTFSSNIHSIYGKPVYYKVKVLDNNARIMRNALVTFKVGNKVYHKRTNSKGFAFIKLNYASGNYIIRYSVDKLSGVNKYVVKNRISLRIMYWGLQGDVSNAPLIKKNIPNNYWVKNAVKATKFGIPLITIKGGNGKTVFMTSGVHGNELPSQVAMMKTIAYLTNRPIKGTVYIIPFVNVKAINNRVRLTDWDYNRIAHVSGTVSNNIVKLILHYKCDSYGDFHSTERPGDPYENIILGYKYPATKCIQLTNYLAKNCNVNKKFYSYAGEVYQWSLADYTNLKGTPAVICEVISKVNTLVPSAVNLSYRMMNQFLIYNKIL